MASIINNTTAQSLIAEYQSQNAASGGPALQTQDGYLLKGYFLDRDSLEAILSDDSVVGVSLILAKHPDSVGSPANQFTVVYVGAIPNTPDSPAPPYISTGDIYCGPPPCPPDCIELTGN